MNFKKTTIILLAALALVPLLVAPMFAFAQNQGVITISPYLPGSIQNVSSSGPCGWIVDFYEFALLISGILAFGAIVFGGVKYATSMGNPSKQSEGRSWIYNALLGLLLLAAAYLVLNIINPNITKCSLPTLSTVNISAPAGGNNPFGGGGSSGGAGASDDYGNGCAGGECGTLPDCTQTQAVSGAGATNCGGAPALVDTLDCIQQADPNFQVSEGYPPAVTHSAACHNNGCCADTVVPSGGCAGVQQLISAAQQCGASVLNEYSNCNGSTFVTTTGNNVHITAPAGGGC